MSKYTDARNAQLVIALLKEYGIRNIIASPGTTNVPFVYSVQNDSFSRFILLLMRDLQHIWHVVWLLNQVNQWCSLAQVLRLRGIICQA